MRWESEAIYLRSRHFSDTFVIAEFFSLNHGFSKGLSRIKKCECFPGFRVNILWSGKLDNQLGYIKHEIIDGSIAKIINNKIKVFALASIMATLSLVLPEKYPKPKLYKTTTDLISYISDNVENLWIFKYIEFELEILSNIGLGLDLKRCSLTGRTEGLDYISSVTGKAISKDHILKYQYKAFHMPKLLYKIAMGYYYIEEFNSMDIIEALKITDYFFNKFFVDPSGLKPPGIRKILIQMLESATN